MTITGTPVSEPGSLTLGALVEWGLRRFGDSRSERDALVVRECVQAALERVSLAGEWPWYNTRARVDLLPTEYPGSLSVTHGDATVTLNDAVVTASMAGGYLQVDGDDYDLLISTADDEANQLELAETYPGTTNAIATGKIQYDRYLLPTNWRQGLSMLTSSLGAARAASLDEWHQAKVNNHLLAGNVVLVAQDGVWLYVAPAPASVGTLQYVYRRFPARVENDNDVLDLPRQLEEPLKAALLVALAEEGHLVQEVPLREQMYRQQMVSARAALRDWTQTQQRTAAGRVPKEEWGTVVNQVLTVS